MAITVKKLQLLDIGCALILFAMSGSANAAIIASDDISIRGTEQSVAVSPSPFPDVALTFDELADSGQIQTDENFNYFIDGASSESPHTDSHISLLLLLIVAFSFGVLLEIFHRRSNR